MSTAHNHQVYAELTPNPNSLKFVTDQILLPEGVAEYKSQKEAADCPLAYQLFDFSGIKSVFISSNFITVTKETDIDWYDITNILREFIIVFLNSGDKIFYVYPQVKKAESKDTATVVPEALYLKKPASSKEETGDVVEKIKSMLDEYVRPAVARDGGAIDFKSFEDGIVTVILKGSCSGCPSSTLTLKAGIENLLKRLVPEVEEVVAEEQ
ncbi:MAG TPA: NifU family protein [Bacteroidia bacterium]|nr:MAG: Fe/S biogenesis protein NfuA [Bacteroidetes bacterium ADurb.Bin141]HNR49332.1 NifU family protein [Bacteroidia bacterium]